MQSTVVPASFEFGFLFPADSFELDVYAVIENIWRFVRTVRSFENKLILNFFLGGGVHCTQGVLAF